MFRVMLKVFASSTQVDLNYIISSESIYLPLQITYAALPIYCPNSLPAIANAKPGPILHRTIHTLIAYTCLNGYMPRNNPAAICNVSARNEGKWDTQGYCIYGITLLSIGMYEILPRSHFADGIKFHQCSFLRRIRVIKGLLLPHTGKNWNLSV